MPREPRPQPLLPWLAACFLAGAGGGLVPAAAAQTGHALPATVVDAAATPAPAASAGVPAPLPEPPSSPVLSSGAAATATPLPAAATAPASAPRAASRRTPRPSGPPWSSLSAEQRTALRPLREHWADIDALRKQKWLEIAQRFHNMAPAERARLHGRMALWASLSPEQRNNARLTFQEAQQLPPEVLHDRWASYLSLSEEERQELARQGTGVPPAHPRAALRRATPGASRTKSNVVPNPLHAAPAQPVAATLLRAWPGATTTALRHPAPPAWHLQPGLPKIAAAPRFIDPKTLAPRVGPQALGVLRSEGGAQP